MAFRATDSDHSLSAPKLESLEPRVLLTTLRGGEYFVYLNSQEQAVRIGIEGTYEDVVEIFALYDRSDILPGTVLTDIPGILYSPYGNGGIFNWEDGHGIIDPETGDWAGLEDDPYQPGAEVEIYSIYVYNLSPAAVITVAELEVTSLIANNFDPNNIAPFSGPEPIIALTDPPTLAPAGSGSGLVGGVPMGIIDDDVVYIASPTNVPFATIGEHGVFPGGDVAAGMMFFRGPGQPVPDVTLGVEVHAVATWVVGVDRTLQAVDTSVLEARNVRDLSEWGLGRDVRAMTVSAGGLPVAIDGAGHVSLGELAVSQTPAWRPLAVDALGQLYTVESSALTSFGIYLTLIDPVTGVAQQFEDLILDDDDNPLLRVWALDYDETAVDDDGNPAPALWGLGDRGGDAQNAGSYLFQFDFGDDDDPLDAGGWQDEFRIDGGLRQVIAMAFSPTGECYVVDSNGDLMTVYLADDATLGVAQGDVNVIGSLGVPGGDVRGIDFIGDTLYMLTDDAVYYVDLAVGTATLAMSFRDVTPGDIAFDANRPGMLAMLTPRADGNHVAWLSLGGTMVSADPLTAEVTEIGVLYDALNPGRVYGNVTALDFDGSLYYGIAGTVVLDPANWAGTNRYLIAFNAAGVVQSSLPLAPQLNFTSIAFDDAGDLYGVVPTGEIYRIDPQALTADATLVAGSSVADLVGIDFIDFGGGERLYGVTASMIYEIGIADGQSVPVLQTAFLGTDVNALTALGADPGLPGLMWSANADTGGYYRLTRAALSATVVDVDPVSAVAGTIGVIYDDQEPTWGFTDVRGLEYDGTGALWAVGRLVETAPLSNGAVPPDGLWLLELTPNPVNGQIRARRVAVLGTDHVSSLAVDGDGQMFAVDPSTNELLRVNHLNGALTVVGVLRDYSSGLPLAEPVTGIDFSYNPQAGVETLFAVTATTRYSVNPGTGVCITAGAVDPATNASGLADDALQPQVLWATYDLGGAFGLARLASDPADTLVRLDAGIVRVSGTVAGTFDNAGNVQLLDMGFLYGDVLVGRNLETIIMRNGGGAVIGPQSQLITPASSLIHVQGTTRFVDSRADTLYTAIEIENDPKIYDPGFVDKRHADPMSYPVGYHISELEYKLPAGANPDGPWLLGQLVDYDNDTIEHAQTLAHPSGEFYLHGEALPSTDSAGDWYAIPLLAGQTLTLQEMLWAPDGEPLPAATFGTPTLLYSPDGRVLDTYGYETDQDWGLYFRAYSEFDEFTGDPLYTLKPMRFTAPEAGVYYLYIAYPAAYNLHIVTEQTEVALGGVNVVGDLAAQWTGLGEGASANISTHRGGHIGAITLVGDMSGVVVQTFQGGDIMAVQAGSIGQVYQRGPSTYSASGNIGGLRTLAGGFWADVVAGAASWNEQGQSIIRHNDAFIQNVFVAGDITAPGSSTFTATGSVGVMEVLGFSDRFYLTVNSDRVGPGGRLDLLNVDGDLYAPSFIHGPGGDIGFVHVGGEIMIQFDQQFSAPLPWTETTDGRTVVLNDDGGNRVAIQPTPIPTLDANGLPVYGPDGQPLVTYPTVRYRMLPVDDVIGGIGGVITDVQIVGGSATVNATGAGLAQIGDLYISAPTPDVEVRLQGSGRTEVYYVHAGAAITSFVNATDGDVISGTLGTVQSVRIKGSLGARQGSTGAWVFGEVDAPAADNITEPQYGWLHNRINGLQILGDAPEVSVAGTIQDLRVTGTLGTVRANADGVTRPGKWDGIEGIVWSGVRIEDIQVGDGLADDGSADRYRAAILSTGSIGRVSIHGPRRVINGRIFGELNGTIAAIAPAFVPELDPFGNPVLDPTGAPVLVRMEAIGAVVGTGGAVCTAIIAAGDLDFGLIFRTGSYIGSDGVNLVSFSGPGASIDGAEIAGLWVDTITTSEDSNGIRNTFVIGYSPLPNELAVGRIRGGGPGLYRLRISTSAGDIGVIEAIGANGDIFGTRVYGTANLNRMSGRDLSYNDIRMPGTITLLQSSRDMYHNVTEGAEGGAYVGAIKKLDVGRNFQDNDIRVASELTSMVVGNDWIDSILYLQGPTIAYLKSLVIHGDLIGQIDLLTNENTSQVLSGARIGEIIVDGAVSGLIKTLPDGWNRDVALIRVGRGFTGDGKILIAGSLGRLQSLASLGDNPAENGGVTQLFEIAGNLGELIVGGFRGAWANLYADINVGGGVRKIDIDGHYYGRVAINNDLDYFRLDGRFGGDLGGAVGQRGSLQVLGDLGKMKMPTRGDVYADLTVGGALKSFKITGGNVYGNLTSLHGYLGTITVVNGTLYGDVTAPYIKKLTVKNGSIQGDVRATTSGIRKLTVISGDIDADVNVDRGELYALTIKGGSLLAGRTITLSEGARKITVRGNVLGDIDSRGSVGKYTVIGNQSGVASFDGGLTAGKVSGALTGTVRSGAGIRKFTAGSAQNAIVSAATDIGSVTIAGNLIGSHLLAGYDVGRDGAIGGTGADADNPQTGAVHAGSLDKLSVGGVFSGSVVAVGVSPGADLDYLTTEDNARAAGISTIYDVTVRGGYQDKGNSAFLAATSIAPKARQGIAPGVMLKVGPNPPVLSGTAPAALSATIPTAGGRAGVLAGSGALGEAGGLMPEPYVVPRPEVGVAGVDFGPGVGTRRLEIAGLALTLTGDGVASFDAGSGQLQLRGTTGRSKLTLSGSSATPITIVAEEGDALGTLDVRGNVTLQDVWVDGQVRSLRAPSVAEGAVWRLPGGVGSADTGALTDVDVEAGTVGTWRVRGSFASGTMKVDEVAKFIVDGAMNGDLETVTGDAGKVQVRGGDFGGQLDVNGGVDSLYVNRSLLGRVNVERGDLWKLIVGENVSGIVDVERGAVGKTTIGGSFGGTDTSSFRVSQDLGKFTVVDGDFTGVLCVYGSIGGLQVLRGAMSGRAWSNGSIAKFVAGSMDSGLLSTSSDIRVAKVRGSITDAWVLAGFSPGDSGASTGLAEMPNLQIDALAREAVAGDAVSTAILDALGASVRDRATGGAIRKMVVGGDVVRSGVAAGVAPGVDGFLGTDDDDVRGVGTVNRMRVGGAVLGSDDAAESFGVFAATGAPNVRFYGRQEFVANGNARAASMADSSGPLRVTDVRWWHDAVEVYFNHDVNVGTVKTLRMHPELTAGEETFSIVVSNGTDTRDATALYDHTLSYDPAFCKVTFRLVDLTWRELGLGESVTFALTLSGNNGGVTDSRGYLLDGEINPTFPSGDGIPGGSFGQTDIGGVSSLARLVPAYIWWFGCGPTAATMLAGYYDGLDVGGTQPWANLIPGDASRQTWEVNNSIASYGTAPDGTPAYYACDEYGPGNPANNTPASLGTGHIGDYSMFNNIDDSAYATPLRDLSDINPGMAHESDSMADFMGTSFSSLGLQLGGSWPDHMVTGIEDYFAFRGYTADARLEDWTSTEYDPGSGQTLDLWQQFMRAIDAGQPVVMGVDSNGDTWADHAIVGTGYDAVGMRYQCYNTWTNQAVWYDWRTPDTYDWSYTSFGVDSVIFVDVEQPAA